MADRLHDAGRGPRRSAEEKQPPHQAQLLVRKIGGRRSRGRSSFLLRWKWSLFWGGEALADALKKNTAITMIDLTWNKIGDAGAKAAVFEETSLQSLPFECQIAYSAGIG